MNFDNILTTNTNSTSAENQDSEVLGGFFQNFTNALGQSEGAVAGIDQNIQKHQQNSQEAQGWMQNLIQNLGVQSEIVAEGQAIKDEAIRKETSFLQAGVDDEQNIHQATREAVADTQELIDTAKRSVEAYQEDFQDLANHLEGKDAEGNTSIFRKISSFLFGGDIREARDRAAAGLSNSIQNLSQIETLKSQMLGNAHAKAALMTESEAQAKRDLLVAQEALDLWQNKGQTAQAQEALLARRKDISKEAAQMAFDQASLYKDKGMLTNQIMNTLLVQSELGLRAKQFGKEEELLDHYSKALAEFNKVKGATLDTKTLAHMMASQQWDQIGKILGPEMFQTVSHYVLFKTGGDPYAKSSWNVLLQQQGTVYTPEDRARQVEFQKYSQYIGGAAEIRKRRDAMIAADGKTVNLLSIEEKNSYEEKARKEILETAHATRMDTASDAALGAGEVIFGEPDFTEYTGDPNVTSKLLAHVDPELRAGTAKSISAFRESIGKTLANAYASSQAEGDLMAELLPVVAKDKVMQSTARNYSNLFQTDNLNDLTLKVNAKDLGLLGSDSPWFGGVGEDLEFDLFDPVAMKNFGMLWRASRKARTTAPLLTAPVTGGILQRSRKAGLENLIQDLKLTHSPRN